MMCIMLQCVKLFFGNDGSPITHLTLNISCYTQSLRILLSLCMIHQLAHQGVDNIEEALLFVWQHADCQQPHPSWADSNEQAPLNLCSHTHSLNFTPDSGM